MQVAAYIPPLDRGRGCVPPGGGHGSNKVFWEKDAGVVRPRCRDAKSLGNDPCRGGGEATKRMEAGDVSYACISAPYCDHDAILLGFGV